MNKKKYRTLVIFGPPGSGKGTQSALLGKLANVYHLSTGDMMRNLPTHTEELKKFREMVDAGKLIPNEAFMKIFEAYLDKLVDQGAFSPDVEWLLLDGVPRSVEQAQGIASYMTIEKVISLEMKDEKALFARLQARGEKEGRVDDSSIEILKTRLQKYQDVTAPVLECYPIDLVLTVNALQKPLEVFKDILACLASDLPFKL